MSTPSSEINRHRRRPRRLRHSRALVVLVAGALTVAACGGSDDDSSDAPTAETATRSPDATVVPEITADAPEPAATDVPTPEAQPNDTNAPDADLDPDAPDLGRVVALAEEFLLADVLTLGVEPIASSATVETAGFQGLDDFDTSGIEVLPMTTLSIEYLASLQPDTIITLQFWLDEIGADLLEGMADVVVVPDGLYGAERLTAMGELLGRPEHAAAGITEYDAALAQAQARIGDDDCEVSLATIYSGPSVAAFVAGPWEIPSSILATGCELDPDADDAAPDGNGRAWLSLEQLGMLDSETLILLQTDAVDGEADSIAEVEANPLWTTLPAVQADQVVVFDRLGYPGLHGQIRFLDEFSALMD